MSSDTTAAHGHAGEVSVWPLVISAGILFALPFAFALQFVYHNGLMAALSLGLGVPMIVLGIVGWTREAIGTAGPAEGLTPPAMGWFILAEALIFLSFFATYWVLRLSSPAWPPEGTPEMPILLPAIMTVVLVSSSFTIHWAEERAEKGDRNGFLKWLLISMGLGVAFLAMSATEWSHLIHEGFVPGSNVYSTSFFSITGFHGAHVVVGLGIFVAMLIPALRGTLSDGLIRSGSMYWHFVDIIWLFVVSQVYYW